MEIDRSITPRQWQAEAVELWAKDLRGVVRVVTGGGKTVFSYLCLQRFFRVHPEGRAIIVVPTLALLDQWFIDICDATDLEESDVACYSGEHRPEFPARVNIVVLNTARRMSRELANSQPSMLVVDECHRSGTKENSRALEGVHEATLGLSATPERDADGGFEILVAPILGPIMYTYGYREAQADGVIVDFNLVNVEITLDTGEAERLGILKKDSAVRNGGRSESRNRSTRAKHIVSGLERAAEVAVRIPWAAKLALAHRRDRVIIFHERVASLRTIGDLLSQHGQNHVSYHSHMSESHRRDNLRLFRQGIVNMLITCRALDEGANVPEANVGVIAQSTRSTRQRIQRLGRVLRPARGKEHALVYTLFAGEEQRTRLTREAKNMEGIAEVIWKRGRIG